MKLANRIVMHTTSCQNRTEGFSLVEVLIALLVLSIGLLGLAALQTTGLRFTQQSYQRTQAVILTYDMFDRIRTNPEGKLLGKYDTVLDGTIPSVALNKCTAGTCTPSEMADWDVANWNTTITQLLSQGTGAISTNPATAIRTITIKWVENDIPMTQKMEAQL
ncbi:MAG: type IV pilus modification protein PilV [Sulfuricaulis sp.]|nr:type IV pilus modification protein PilV [Sulfuricaulis sp.]